MDPVSERRLKDEALTVSTALPNAGNTVYTNVIDLGKAKPFPVQDSFHVKLSTSTATGANNKNITVRLQHSAEANANFTNIAELGSLVVTDDNGSGYPAGSLTVSLPPGTKQYIRAAAAGEANGGNASNGQLTVEFLF